jgi:hypothetical protein
MLLEQLASYKLDGTGIQERRWLGKGVMGKRDHVVFYSCQKKSYVWKEHYDMTMVLNQGNSETKEPVPTTNEVEQAFKKLRYNKAPGIDLIPAELVKFAGPEYVKHLHQLIVKIWITEIIPKEWYLSTVGPLRFEVSKVVTIKNGVFWEVMPSGSCKNRRIGGT